MGPDAQILIIFLFEVFLGTICIFYMKIANDWALETIAVVEKDGEKAIELIKEIRLDLVKLNKILNFIKGFKFSRIKNIMAKAFDIVGIFALLYPGGKKIKFTRFVGLKLAKSLFSLLKPV